ncbi:MAG: ABC transporter permease [Deltaproteobacteria bacterium]|nr:ABC transporter permease [Deltaproteobacteria bacterium]MCL5792835.1 ABC transporter permease [Deltaproteobacteria bacterium]
MINWKLFLLRVKAIARKEFIQLRRDKRMLFIAFMAPIIQLTLFGYAATLDVKSVPVVVCDMDQSMQSRTILNDITASGYFVIQNRVPSIRDVRKSLDDGEDMVGIVIPEGLERDINGDRKAYIQTVIDGSNAIYATMVRSYLERIITNRALELSAEQMSKTGLKPFTPLDIQPRVWYNPTLKSMDFMVPGVFALVLMIISTVLTSMAIVKEKERGTIEQLIVTPIKPIELIAGKLLPFAIISLIDITLVTMVSVFWFQIPLHGSFILLFLLSALFMLTTLGLGLLISTVSKTQQQAMMISMLLIMPIILLSGVMSPIDNMPVAVQYFTFLIPLRYFIVIVRYIFMKGSGMYILWPDALALAFFGIVLFLLSVSRFKKRLG